MVKSRKFSIELESREDSFTMISMRFEYSGVTFISPRRNCTDPEIDARGLRISCARPAAISPIRARCSRSFSSCSIRFLSVRSVRIKTKTSSMAYRAVKRVIVIPMIRPFNSFSR